jgi:hypothetical protein
MTPPFVFLAHRSLLDQHTAHGEINQWLQKQGGVSDVRYMPSSIRRHEIHASVDPTVLFGEPLASENVDLRVAFAFPENAGYDYYEIQWTNTEEGYSFGWHQDETHPDLGKCHFQLDYGDRTVTREPAIFHDSHPLGVLEERLWMVPSILNLIEWEDGTPLLSRWPPPDI